MEDELTYKRTKKSLIRFTISFIDFSLYTNLGIVFNTYTQKNQFCFVSIKCQALNVIFSKGLIVMNTQEYPK